MVRSDFGPILQQRQARKICTQLSMLGCYHDDEISSKMMVSINFLCFFHHFGHVFCVMATNFHYQKYDFFYEFWPKLTIFPRCRFLSFQLTPTSYQLVPNLARRDLFKNDKIGPTGGFPPKNSDSSRFHKNWSKVDPFWGKNIFQNFFSPFLPSRTRRVKQKSL